jgi:glycine/D-amino acid oxidase-like deaminating enzyme
MKKAIVVGAGFAGLAAAYFLSQKYQVTVMDQQGIGAGASGVSSGLLHPYPGEKGRRSWEADEALEKTRYLLQLSEEALGQPVAIYNGVLRKGSLLNPGADVIPLGPQEYLITSGMTVFASLYLEGLAKSLQQKGVEFVTGTFKNLSTLDRYEAVVLAVGSGLRSLSEKELVNVNYVKGQVLCCRLQQPLERSISSKVYIALTPNPLECHLGATYERDVINQEVNMSKAIELLKPPYPVLDCKAGIRVTNPAHYFPILYQISSRVVLITALGSRGLLYHALMAHRAAALL